MWYDYQIVDTNRLAMAFAESADAEGAHLANYAEAQDKNDSGHSKAMLANVALGVGGAAVIGAAVLWFTGAPKASAEESVGIAPHIAPGYTGVSVRLHF